MKLKDACSLVKKKSYDQLRQHVKKLRHHFANKGPFSQNDVFSSSHVGMWKLDSKEGWALKNWCFQNVTLEKTFESPLDYKEIKPVNPKESTILWSPDVNSHLIGIGPDSGKDWGQEEKWTTEDEMIGWHHQLSGQELRNPRDSEGQGSLACCSLWVMKSQILLSDQTTATQGW